MLEIIMLEPRAAWAAGVAHNPPLDRQASWHQCLPECQRVDLLRHVKHGTLEIRLLREKDVGLSQLKKTGLHARRPNVLQVLEHHVVRLLHEQCLRLAQPRESLRIQRRQPRIQMGRPKGALRRT